MSIKTNSLSSQVGARIKARRERLELSLRALAARSNLSGSAISDIERGLKSPTLSTLGLIAEALNVSVSSLLDDDRPPRIRVARKSSQRTAVEPKSGSSRQYIGAEIPGSRIEILRYRLPAGAKAGPFAAHREGTIEHIHVASGSLTVLIGDESSKLNAGDSCSAYTDAEHWFDNAGGRVDAVVYLVQEFTD